MYQTSRLQQDSRELTHSHTGHQSNLSRCWVITSPSRLHTFLCFPQSKRLYLVSFGVILSNSGQVTCHISALQSKDVWNTKLTLTKTYSDLPFFLMRKIPKLQHISTAQQVTWRNKFQKLKMVHLYSSDCSLHLCCSSHCCEGNS